MKSLCICAAMMVAIVAVAQAPDPAQTSTPSAPVLASQTKPAAADVIQKVKLALSQTDLSANTISVSTHADTIVLTGQAGSTTDSAKAALAAQTAAGNVRIINEIEVPAVDHSPQASGGPANAGK